MGATTQCMLEEMDNDWESTWTMLTQLESTSGGSYLEDLMEGETPQYSRLMEIKQKDHAELTDDDKKFLVENFDNIEMAYHYQDVATKDD